MAESDSDRDVGEIRETCRYRYSGYGPKLGPDRSAESRTDLLHLLYKTQCELTGPLVPQLGFQSA